jgi:uncharacterized protein
MPKICVLSIDGGGIRGIGPAHILTKLDVALDHARKPPVNDIFNLFVGTSTGSIVAAGLAADGQAAAPLKPTDIVALYQANGKAMFTPQFPHVAIAQLVEGKYQQEAKGAVLRTILGELTMGQIERNLLTTFYNVGTGPGAMFPNGGTEYRTNGDDDYHDLPVWQAVNASSSAPFYFDPSPLTVKGTPMMGADGGLFANNPAMCAFVEAKKIWPDSEIVLASFGCGHTSLEYPGRRHWGLNEWASLNDGMPMLEAMFDGQSDSVTYQLNRILGPDHFFRFDFNLDPYGSIPLDGTNPDQLATIIRAADDFLAGDGGPLLERLVAAL